MSEIVQRVKALSSITQKGEPVSIPRIRGRRKIPNCRELILDAARNVFLRDGIHGGTIRAIAQRAGLSTTMIYYHFGSKEALAQAVVDRAYHSLLQEMESLATPVVEGGQLYPRPCGQIALLKRHLGEKAALGVLIRDPTIGRYGALKSYIASICREMRTTLRGFLVQGKDDGFLRHDLPLEAFTNLLLPFPSGVFGILPEPIDQGTLDPLKEAALMAEEAWQETLWWSISMDSKFAATLLRRGEYLAPPLNRPI